MSIEFPAIIYVLDIHLAMSTCAGPDEYRHTCALHFRSPPMVFTWLHHVIHHNCVCSAPRPLYHKVNSIVSHFMYGIIKNPIKKYYKWTYHIISEASCPHDIQITHMSRIRLATTDDDDRKSIACVDVMMISPRSKQTNKQTHLI